MLLKGKITDATVSDESVTFHVTMQNGEMSGTLTCTKTYAAMKSEDLQVGAPLKVEVQFDPDS